MPPEIPDVPNTSGRELEDLVKGYWDPVAQMHVPGVIERLVKIEKKIKLLPQSVWFLIAVTIADVLVHGGNVAQFAAGIIANLSHTDMRVP